MTMHAPSLGCCDDMTAVQVSQRHINLICACLSSPVDSSTLGLSSSQALSGCNMAKRKHQDSASSDSGTFPAAKVCFRMRLFFGTLYPLRAGLAVFY